MHRAVAAQRDSARIRQRLQRPPQARRRNRDRPVPRRLPRALSRPVLRRRLPPVPRSRRILHRLQLRLRQHPHRPRTCHPLHRKLLQRPRHHCQRMVGPTEEKARNLGGRRHHKTGRSRPRRPRRVPAQPDDRHARRRTKTSHRRQSPRLRRFPQRSRRRPPRRILRRRRLLDRPQNRRLGHLNLLPPRSPRLGPQFQRQPFYGRTRRKILEPRMER